MAERTHRTLKDRLRAGGVLAVVAALCFAAAPAAAQWWEDDEAYGVYESEGFADYDFYENYGYDDEVALDREEYYDRMEERTDELDDTPYVSDAVEDYYDEREERADWGIYEDEGAGYYDDGFGEGWNGWFD